MLHIPIISSKTGFQKKSHRASLYFKKYLEENEIVTTEILDIENFNYLQQGADSKKNIITDKKNQAERKIQVSDGIIIVSPVCDGHYPESFKSIIKLLYEDWRDTPIAIATVSTGPFERSQLVITLRLMLWKIMATSIPAFRNFPKEIDPYDKNGNANDKLLADKHAAIFIKKLIHRINAIKNTRIHTSN